MMLKSVEKLRKKLEEDTAGDFVFTTYPEQHGFRAGATIENYEAIADEIEQEVSERYMGLPVDADGVPIRVGDVLEWVPYDDTYQPVIRTVSGVGADVFFAWGDEKCNYAQYNAQAYRHHHKPTVEDVLRDMHAKLDEVTALYVGEAIDSDERDSDEARIFAEYASKLRLAGDAE